VALRGTTAILAEAGVGAWLSGMVGMSVGNIKIKEFESALKAGECPVLADVPKDRVEGTEYLVKQHLPWVIVEVLELEISTLLTARI